jgi:Mn-containing catalase
MFLRIDKLQIELPAPKKQDPNAAAALQELLGGKYGEMSTLGNYMFQSFNFRSKSKLRPFYSLVAAITAEELGHVELVSNGVAMQRVARRRKRQRRPHSPLLIMRRGRSSGVQGRAFC